MFHNLYICSCITCCLIVYNYLYYHALCGAFSEIKSFKVSKFQRLQVKLPSRFPLMNHKEPV